MTLAKKNETTWRNTIIDKFNSQQNYWWYYVIIIFTEESVFRASGCCQSNHWLYWHCGFVSSGSSTYVCAYYLRWVPFIGDILLRLNFNPEVRQYKGQRLIVAWENNIKIIFNYIFMYLLFLSAKSRYSTRPFCTLLVSLQIAIKNTKLLFLEAHSLLKL